MTGGSAVFMSRVPTVHELKEKQVLPGPGEYDGATCSDLKALMEPVEHVSKTRREGQWLNQLHNPYSKPYKEMQEHNSQKSGEEKKRRIEEVKQRLFKGLESKRFLSHKPRKACPIQYEQRTLYEEQGGRVAARARHLY